MATSDMPSNSMQLCTSPMRHHLHPTKCLVTVTDDSMHNSVIAFRSDRVLDKYQDHYRLRGQWLQD